MDRLLGCAAFSRGARVYRRPPRDKRQQKKLIPLCIILFAHLLGPPLPPQGGLGLQTE